MFKIAICDDSEYMRNETEKYLLKYSMQRDFDYTVRKFENGESMLKHGHDLNIIFLDYEFAGKGADGMTIAKEIRKINRDVVIIFLSSYPSIVFRSFEVGTFRFLVKPIEEEAFFRALDDLIREMERDDVLTVKIDGTNYFIQGKQITYIEGDGKNCIIHCIDKDETMESHETLSNVEQRLSKKNFFRCHKSFLVNLRYVSSYNHTDLILEDKGVIMISRQRYKPFVEAYSQYLMEHKG